MRSATIILGQMGVGKSTEASKSINNSMVINPVFRRSTRIIANKVKLLSNETLRNIIIDDLLSFTDSNFSRLLETLKLHKDVNFIISSIPYFITNVEESRKKLISRILTIVTMFKVEKVEIKVILCKNKDNELLNIPVGVDPKTGSYVGYKEPTPGDLIEEVEGERTVDRITVEGYTKEQLIKILNNKTQLAGHKDVETQLSKLPQITIPLHLEGKYKVITFSELTKYTK